MKYNLKKVATVLGSALMLGSTVALAAAASYPAPFVQNGAANVAIVVGANSALSDGLAATQVSTGLASALAAQTASGSTPSTSTATGGDSVKLQSESGNDLFNLGETTSGFYSTLDSEELSTILADGIYEDDDGDEFDYEQEIVLGSNTLSFFMDSELDENEVPTVGFDMVSGAAILNYTLDFTDAADGGAAVSSDEYPALSETYVEMMGREYYISDVEMSSNGVLITLLDSANEATIVKGETTTLSVGNKTYEIDLTFVHSTNGVKLTINGEDTGLLDEGDTKKLSDGSYVSILENLAGEDADADSAKISIGTGKIELESNQEVQFNNEDVSDIDEYEGNVLTAYITNTSTTISQVTIAWTLDDDAWLVEGRELVMPGFKNLKLAMTDFVVPSEEITTIDDNSDSVSINTVIEEGSVEFSILNTDSTVVNFTSLGEDSNDVLVTNGTSATTTNAQLALNESQNSYFVATWISGDDGESYAYEIDKIENADGDNKTTLKSLVSGGSDVVFSEVGDTQDVGSIRLTLVAASDSAGTATIGYKRTGSSGTVYSDRLVTKAGLEMLLPVDSLAAGLNNVNLTVTPSTYTIVFYEENDDGDIGSGNQFNVTVGTDAGDGTEPTDTDGVTLFASEDGSDVDVGRVSSPLATWIEFDNPSGNALNDVKIVYSGSEAYAEVFVSEMATAFGTSDGSSGATELGSVTVTDAEAASVSSKNLIVIGGSCINKVAADLLGSATPLCGQAFTDKTGIKAGEALIKSFSKNGKVALLVAGYNAEDTTKAATYLVNTAVNTTVGSALKVTSATEATAITA